MYIYNVGTVPPNLLLHRFVQCWNIQCKLHNCPVCHPVIGLRYDTQSLPQPPLVDHMLPQWLKWLKKKRLPVMQETRVQSLAWKDPLEKEMATCSSILAWEIPSKTEQQRSLMGQSPWESQRVRHNLATKPPLQQNKNQRLPSCAVKILVKLDSGGRHMSKPPDRA